MRASGQVVVWWNNKLFLIIVVMTATLKLPIKCVRILINMVRMSSVNTMIQWFHQWKRERERQSMCVGVGVYVQKWERVAKKDTTASGTERASKAHGVSLPTQWKPCSSWLCLCQKLQYYPFVNVYVCGRVYYWRLRAALRDCEERSEREIEWWNKLNSLIDQKDSTIKFNQEG